MNIVDLSKEANRGDLRTPEQMLEEALEVIRDPKDDSNFKHADKMMIISLNSENGEYLVNWLQAGMRMSECVALCEVAKIKFISEMDHLVTPENLERMLEP